MHAPWLAGCLLAALAAPPALPPGVEFIARGYFGPLRTDGVSILAQYHELGVASLNYDANGVCTGTGRLRYAVYDVAGRRLFDLPWPSERGSIQAYSGNRFIVRRHSPNGWQLALYDLSTDSEIIISAAATPHSGAALSGNLVVWSDWFELAEGKAVGSVNGYDLLNHKAFTISKNGGGAAVAGDLVAWSDFRDRDEALFAQSGGRVGGDNIFGARVTLREGEPPAINEFRIGTQHRENQGPLMVSGDLVVWHDWRNHIWREGNEWVVDCGGTDLFGWDASTDREFHVYRGKAHLAGFAGRHVAWLSADVPVGPYGVDVLDLSTGRKYSPWPQSAVARDPYSCMSPGGNPVVCGNKVFWHMHSEKSVDGGEKYDSGIYAFTVPM